MPEDVRQSTESHSFNADRTNNLVGNLVRKPIQMPAEDIFNNYKPKESCNNFSKVKEEQKAEFVEFI